MFSDFARSINKLWFDYVFLNLDIPASFIYAYQFRFKLTILSFFKAVHSMLHSTGTPTNFLIHGHNNGFSTVFDLLKPIKNNKIYLL